MSAGGLCLIANSSRATPFLSLTPEEIDKINILNASFLAMHRALDQLKVRPEAVIVDGNRFKPYKDLPYLWQQPTSMTTPTRL